MSGEGGGVKGEREAPTGEKEGAHSGGVSATEREVISGVVFSGAARIHVSCRLWWGRGGEGRGRGLIDRKRTPGLPALLWRPARGGPARQHH